MSTFLKYLLSLAFHTAWMRAGKSGPVPPIRLPKGKSVPLPVIGPWQMLLVSWALSKLWQRYGDDVRAKVSKVDLRVAERIHDWLPSTRKSAGRSKSAPPTTFVIPGIPAPAPAGAATAGAAAPTAKTQRMPGQTPGKAPSGSLLSRLRKGA